MVTIKVCIYDGASWFCGCGDDRSDDVQRTSTVLFLKWVRGLLIECNCMLTSTTDTVLMSLYKVCVEWQDVFVCVCVCAYRQRVYPRWTSLFTGSREGMPLVSP